MGAKSMLEVVRDADFEEESALESAIKLAGTGEL